MKNALLTSLMAASCLYAAAQPTMISDLNSGMASSNPTWTTGLNSGKVLFFANDGVNGYELCVVDSSAHIKYDLNPGMADGGVANYNAKMAIVGEAVYFVGNNGATGNELYMWNGNDSVMPTLVSDIYVGGTGSSITEIVVIDGKLYFNASNASNGNELWSYNPATSYIQRLTDLTAGVGSSNPHNIVAFNNKVYFSASATTTGSELYVYDPVANTTMLAADVATGTPSSDPMGTMVINNKLYFSATTTSFGRELYSFDGTILSRLTNVDNSSSDGVIPVTSGQVQFALFKGKIHFSGSNGATSSQLYSYNPVNGVTSIVYAINPAGPSSPKDFTIYGGNLFFSADDGTNGTELWMYNGTNIPAIYADIDTNSFMGSMPQCFLKYGTKLYFSATTLDFGTELYSMFDSSALGIQNVRFDGKVVISPNPTTGAAKLTVALNTPMQLAYTITDVTGKLVDRSDVNAFAAGENTININLQNAASGIYVYRLTDSKGALMASGRIEKQ
jgi:ELWxxDGT repeat protein